ncbi:MAG: hypothetical protein HXS48_12040 [Theionarchaea archaeon]|nr:MAG: hypothetical protein AYK19_17130 [Theionarchaea archaeon DG-70-1]MBU7027657.1 hypothetical protein [Theionarchaea archaeon]
MLCAKGAMMHLEKARELGKKAGLETDEECIFYVFQHCKELFKVENIWKEINELAEEAEKEGIAVPGKEFF